MPQTPREIPWRNPPGGPPRGSSRGIHWGDPPGPPIRIADCHLDSGLPQGPPRGSPNPPPRNKIQNRFTNWCKGLNIDKILMLIPNLPPDWMRYDLNLYILRIVSTRIDLKGRSQLLSVFDAMIESRV